MVLNYQKMICSVSNIINTATDVNNHYVINERITRNLGTHKRGISRKFVRYFCTGGFRSRQTSQRFHAAGCHCPSEHGPQRHLAGRQRIPRKASGRHHRRSRMDFWCDALHRAGRLSRRCHPGRVGVSREHLTGRRTVIVLRPDALL